MKNKKLFKKILLIALAIIVLGGAVAGGIYYYKTKKVEKQTKDTTVKKQEQVIENKSNSKRTSIDDKWDLYTNYDLGFSIKIPKENVMDTAGNKVPVEVIEPEKWPNAVHIVAGTENAKWHQEKIDSAKSELESVKNVPFAILIRDNINNDSDIEKFIQERYGDQCGMLEKKATTQEGVFDIHIKGSGTPDDIVKNPNAKICWINWYYVIKYDSNSKKIASWDGGQDYGFRIENTIEGVDYEMTDSFRFIEQPIQNDTQSQNPDLNEVKRNSISLDGWKTYDTVEHGWKEGLDATIKYPSDWHTNVGAGGTFVNSWLGDFNLGETMPTEHCQVIFGYDGSKSEKGLSVKLENTYTDNAKKENCKAILEAMKGTLTSKITPVTYYTE